MIARILFLGFLALLGGTGGALAADYLGQSLVADRAPAWEDESAPAGTPTTLDFSVLPRYQPRIGAVCVSIEVGGTEDNVLVQMFDIDATSIPATPLETPADRTWSQVQRIRPLAVRPPRILCGRWRGMVYQPETGTPPVSVVVLN